MTELLCVVQHCFVGRVELEGQLILVGDPATQIQSQDVENKVLTPESGAISCIVSFKAPKCSPEAILISKLRLFQSFSFNVVHFSTLQRLCDVWALL